jgi:hypothetical protein
MVLRQAERQTEELLQQQAVLIGATMVAAGLTERQVAEIMATSQEAFDRWTKVRWAMFKAREEAGLCPSCGGHHDDDHEDEAAITTAVSLTDADIREGLKLD